MSGIGNTNENSNGSRSNYAWQKSMVQMLKAISTSLGPAPVQYTPHVVQATTNGSTTAGVRAFSIWFRGTGGTLAGVSVPDNGVIEYAADRPDTLAAIAYTVPTTGEARVIISYF